MITALTFAHDEGAQRTSSRVCEKRHHEDPVGGLGTREDEEQTQKQAGQRPAPDREEQEEHNQAESGESGQDEGRPALPSCVAQSLVPEGAEGAVEALQGEDDDG